MPRSAAAAARSPSRSAATGTVHIAARSTTRPSAMRGTNGSSPRSPSAQRARRAQPVARDEVEEARQRRRQARVVGGRPDDVDARAAAARAQRDALALDADHDVVERDRVDALGVDVDRDDRVGRQRVRQHVADPRPGRGEERLGGDHVAVRAVADRRAPDGAERVVLVLGEAARGAAAAVAWPAARRARAGTRRARSPRTRARRRRRRPRGWAAARRRPAAQRSRPSRARAAPARAGRAASAVPISSASRVRRGGSGLPPGPCACLGFRSAGSGRSRRGCRSRSARPGRAAESSARPTRSAP